MRGDGNIILVSPTAIFYNRVSHHKTRFCFPRLSCSFASTAYSVWAFLKLHIRSLLILGGHVCCSKNFLIPHQAFAVVAHEVTSFLHALLISDGGMPCFGSLGRTGEKSRHWLGLGGISRCTFGAHPARYRRREIPCTTMFTLYFYVALGGAV